MNHLVFKLFLFYFSFLLIKVSSNTIWTPLLSSSKRITILPEATFDEANSRCEKLHGHLIDFSDGYEVVKVANEIVTLFPTSSSDLWIGVRKRGFYYKWTTGKYFDSNKFNVSKEELILDNTHGNSLCGALFTGKFYRETSYQFVMVDCWHSKKSICQAFIDPYEAISITAMVVSGICLLIFIALAIWWFVIRRKRPNYSLSALSVEDHQVKRVEK